MQGWLWELTTQWKQGCNGNHTKRLSDGEFQILHVIHFATSTSLGLLTLFSSSFKWIYLGFSRMRLWCVRFKDILYGFFSFVLCINTYVCTGAHVQLKHGNQWALWIVFMWISQLRYWAMILNEVTIAEN